MPINSYTCEDCGTRNNYIVDIDDSGNQMVSCSSCGSTRSIPYDELPERVRETMENLNNDAKIFEDDQAILPDDDTDTVDETLEQVEQRFKEAQNAMSSFDHIVKIDTTMEGIADEYISDDVSTKAKDYASAVLDDSGKLRDDWKRSGFTKAVDEINERISDDDSTSARIASYIQSGLKAGAGMDSILDPENMKRAGLGKKERFILKQAAKNNQLSSILGQILGD